MLQVSKVIVAAVAVSIIACQPAATELTDEQRAAIRDAVEQTWSGMMDAAHARDADGIRAGYAEDVVAVLNGVIIEDFDARFELTRQWLSSLRALEGSYKNVHIEVLAPDVVVVTRNDDLTWTDSSGLEGEWHSAWTGVFRRINGEWKIIYSHESLPLPESM